jgi:hypothetical protein
LTYVLALILSSFAIGQERKIQRADLPPAVEKTVAAQSHGATIKGFSTEKEKGETFYEAEMTINGHSKDILIDAKGNLAEIEEEVAFESLPATVKAGLQAKAGSGKIMKVESLTKHDQVVAYEAQVRTGARRSEIQVGPDGKPLTHAE